jgi:hypothetical protein
VRKLLVFLGVAWIATNLIGAWLSVEHDRPYDLSFLDQPGTVSQIGNDWLRGWGSGLAMPLWVLAIAAVLTVVVSFDGSATRLSSVLLMVLGALSIAFTLANQPTYDRLKATATDRGETAVVIASLVLAGMMVLIGLITVITTPRTPRR